GRLDEGPADVMVADDAKLERNAALGRIADGGRHAGIRHRDDDIGFQRVLARQFGADPLARLVDAAALDLRVRPREIDVFEDAEAPSHPGEGEVAVEPVTVDDDQLARLDIAYKLGAEDVQRTGLGGEDRRALQVAQHQRPDAPGIAHADQLLRGQCHQRVGTLDLFEGIDDAIHHGRLAAQRYQMRDDFRVHGGPEDAALGY